MKISVIMDDRVVIVNGEPRKLESMIGSKNVHAIQWYGDYGELEYKSSLISNKYIEWEDVKPYYEAWKNVKKS